jgi:hypothetical protein
MCVLLVGALDIRRVGGILEMDTDSPATITGSGSRPHRRARQCGAMISPTGADIEKRPPTGRFNERDRLSAVSSNFLPFAQFERLLPLKGARPCFAIAIR